MKTLITAMLVVIVAIGCSAMFQSGSTSVESKYTRKDFKAAKDTISNRDSLLVLCRNYAKNATGINAVRDVQDSWMELNSKDALAYYKEEYRNNPQSAICTYLYGRLLPNRLERLKMGRKTIELAPDWSYGYRLALYCYYTHLFLEQGDAETIDSLKTTFSGDEELFYKFDAMYKDRWFNGKMMFHYYLYKGDVNGAKEELDNAHTWNWSWVKEAEELLRAKTGEYPKSEGDDSNN
ncbi:MAG: hypothetical protein P9X24_08500 [Candidatus Hatepunaea meridiana]|nr:hypothetical protein [Candidatus Hatepunaea meridiana]